MDCRTSFQFRLQAAKANRSLECPLSSTSLDFGTMDEQYNNELWKNWWFKFIIYCFFLAVVRDYLGNRNEDRCLTNSPLQVDISVDLSI